ncbi:hypothetical protein HDU96_001622 [Phlyctochytrium bullatum]|nr:hypothetical protein HDU96_001622 [Phlyctochytrium bullatum]
MPDSDFRQLQDLPVDLLEAIARFLHPSDTLSLQNALAFPGAIIGTDADNGPRRRQPVFPFQISVSLARHQLCSLVEHEIAARTPGNNGIVSAATAVAAEPQNPPSFAIGIAVDDVRRSLKRLPWAKLGLAYYNAALLEFGFSRQLLEVLDPHNPSFYHRPPAFYQPPPPFGAAVSESKPPLPWPPAHAHQSCCEQHLLRPPTRISEDVAEHVSPPPQVTKLAAAVSRTLESGGCPQVIGEPWLAALWSARHGHVELVLRFLDVFAEGLHTPIPGLSLGKPDVDALLAVLGEHGDMSGMLAVMEWCERRETDHEAPQEHWGDPTSFKDHALRLAARNGYADVVSYLLGNQIIEAALLPSPVDSSPHRWWHSDPTALFDYALRWSAAGGHLDILRLLLSTGRCDPAALSNQAIVLAAQEGHLDCVRHLLSLPASSGVDPTAQRDHAIRWACHNGHVNVAEVLLRWRGVAGVHQRVMVDPGAMEDEALRWAAQRGDVEIVRLLLKVGTESGQHVHPDAHDNAAVMWAAVEGHEEVVRILLATGKVDPTVQANRALIKAAEKGFAAVVRLLLEYGMKPHTVQPGPGAWRLEDEHAELEESPLLSSNRRSVEEAMRVAANNGHEDVLAILHEYRVLS